MTVDSHVSYEDYSAGSSAIDAIIRAAAIEQILPCEDDKCIVIWKANAAEQWEAAMEEMGWKMVKVKRDDE